MKKEITAEKKKLTAEIKKIEKLCKLQQKMITVLVKTMNDAGTIYNKGHDLYELLIKKTKEL